MVKPSKSMQPEHVDLQEASKKTGKGAAFGEDSFRNYMALKIATQRKQFGLVLPPPPKPDIAPTNISNRKLSSSSNQEISEGCEAGQKRKRLTNEHHSVHLGKDIPLAQSAELKPLSGRVLRPALNRAANPASKAPVASKRPTLLEQPLSSQMAYSASPSRSRSGPSDRSVRFADDPNLKKNKPTINKKSKMESMINRLKKRHGRGNRRLERKHAKKRKTERSSNNKNGTLDTRIERDPFLESCTHEDSEATHVKMDSPMESTTKENGLEELNKLFAMADENHFEVAWKSDEDNIESKNYNKGESETIISPLETKLENEDIKPTLKNRDGLAELDRMFASADAANEDSVSSSPRKDLTVNNEHKRSLIELDDLLASSGTTNDNKDQDSFGFESAGTGDTNQISSESGQNAAAIEDFPQSNRNELGSASASASAKQIGNEANTMVFSTNEEEEEEHEQLSIPSTAADSAPAMSPKSIRKLRPDLFFYGIVVKVAGYTHPDNETIKRLLQKHGGDLETYETERVTHIIAQQLLMAKANVYKKARRPRPVCRPSWIVDSVREGKLLPHGKYLLIEERDQQQMGIQKMFAQQTEASRKEPPKTSIATSSPQKPTIIHKNPYAKKTSIHSPEKQDENLSITGATAQISATSHDLVRKQESPLKTDKRLINGKIRTVGTDPNFLDSYFASSRLSFIGSFKQREKSTHPSNGTVSSSLLSNSKKLIFHVDMDCFFASVVLRNYPQYQDKPVVISHHGNRSDEERKDDERGNNASHGHVPKNSHSECATCNYEARKYGIKKGMFLGRAKELCPELIILMYDFEGYEEVSQQVSDILDRLASSESHPGIVESVSCDESYVELNFESSDDSKALYDRAFEVAESIRNEIYDTTQCTASIGVGENKFLAKLGTDKAKPNKSYCVRDYRELLKDLSLREVHGVGWRTEKKLIDEGLVTIQDVWDLGARGETELIRVLGPVTGKKIFGFTQGKDDRTITPVERKTIGAECNYGVRFDGPYGIDHFMDGLAKEVQKRMEGISMKGKKLTLKIKQRKKGASNRHKFLGHGSCHNLSKSIVIPGNVATRDSKIFKRTGLILFKEFGIADINEIRGMGIVISNLEADNSAGKTMNISGMEHWLQKSNELENTKSDETANETIASKDIVSVSTATANGVVPSNPNQSKKLEEGTGIIAAVNEVRNKESQPTIQLPPMSQIHMSQIKALPSELQKEVHSRLKEYIPGILEEDQSEGSLGEVMIRNKNGTPKQSLGKEPPPKSSNFLSTPQSTEMDDDVIVFDGQATSSKNIESPLLIELPPMSQIQMSQVEALPDELKEQVYSRMNQRATDVTQQIEIVDMTDEDKPTTGVFRKHHVGSEQQQQQQSSNRFRQTDLKRMMKLAAVRSGHDNTNISLTQLDELPLEIKLQVVNGDNQQIGVLSQHAPHRSRTSSNRPTKKSAINTVNAAAEEPSVPKKRRSVSNHSSRNRREQTKVADANTVVGNSIAVETKTSPLQQQESRRRELRITARVDVWKEDVLPLKEFLRDNCPLKHPESVDMVFEFLSIVLQEGRLPSMVTMIRCIRNQTNHWSKNEILETIVDKVNKLHTERYGASLDVDWLLGREE